MNIQLFAYIIMVLQSGPQGSRVLEDHRQVMLDETKAREEYTRLLREKTNTYDRHAGIKISAELFVPLIEDCVVMWMPEKTIASYIKMNAQEVPA